MNDILPDIEISIKKMLISLNKYFIGILTRKTAFEINLLKIKKKFMQIARYINIKHNIYKRCEIDSIIQSIPYAISNFFFFLFIVVTFFFLQFRNNIKKKNIMVVTSKVPTWVCPF